ncbi:MAG: hypothetical protein R2789_14405 [Microthrixaceae bacterium]
MTAIPTWPQKCGLDMTIIIDRSGSIGNYNDDVADAANCASTTACPTRARRCR